MATFNINCPHCGGTLEVQDEWAGMETACPLCQSSLVIPRREVQGRTTARRATPPSPPPQPVQSPPPVAHSGPPENSCDNGELSDEKPQNPLSSPYARCFDCRGRSTRLEFFIFELLCRFVYILFLISTGVYIASVFRDLPFASAAYAFSIILFILLLFLATAGTFLFIRRLHDTGRSGLFILFTLIPLGTTVLTLILLFIPSQPTGNEYGSCPN